LVDYNSPYTGAEVDAAIAKTDGILESVAVWEGVPTNVGVPLSSLSVNPGTGDRTGTYDVLYSETATDVETSAGTPALSRIQLLEETQFAIGSGHSDMTDTVLYSSSVDFSKDSDGNFKGVVSAHTFGTGIATHTDLYIHKIYRLQQA